MDMHDRSRLEAFSVPELCDGMKVFRAMDPGIHLIAGQGRIVGRALTVRVPMGDGGFIPDAILAAKPGDVLVIDGQGNTRSSYWGDLRSLSALNAGVAGVVIDGAFRDIEGCDAIGLPVYARGLTPGTALKTNQGEMNIPVSCGGVSVQPGDWIVADRNGVCVIRPEELEDVLVRAQTKRRAVEYTMNRMRNTREVLPRLIQPEE